MNTTTCTALVALLAATFLAACAHPPGSAAAHAETTVAAARTCPQLHAGIAAAEQALGDAQQRKEDAWKVIVPFAVAARHAQAKSAMGDAEQRLAELKLAAERQGCSHGH